jgi:hypothetical protein
MFDKAGRWIMLRQWLLCAAQALAAYVKQHCAR